MNQLTHFHYVPPHIEKESNVKAMETVPSLSLEEHIPIAESTAVINAPEERFEKLKGRKASLLGSGDLTSDDKKRLRRARKKSKKGFTNISADKQLLNELKGDKRVTINDNSSDDKREKNPVFSMVKNQAQREINAKKRE